MCCEPWHVGAPIEWHRECAEAPLPVPAPRVGPAILAAWARLLEPRHFTATVPLASTQAGCGRALPGRSTKDQTILPDLPLSEDFNRWRGPI